MNVDYIFKISKIRLKVSKTTKRGQDCFLIDHDYLPFSSEDYWNKWDSGFLVLMLIAHNHVSSILQAISGTASETIIASNINLFKGHYCKTFRYAIAGKKITSIEQMPCLLFYYQ